MEKKRSAVEQRIRERIALVLLVRGENPDGEAIYAYVGIFGDRLEEFMAAQGSATFYPEDFGQIIEAGEGEPSDEVRLRMETVYGFDHEAMRDIDRRRKGAPNLTQLPDMLPPGSQL